MKEKGIVKWFDNKQGYGFLLDEKGEDVFVHYTAIKVAEGVREYRTLAPDQKVEFERTEGKKKGEFAALNVCVL